jgi:F5/8 type C domain
VHHVLKRSVAALLAGVALAASALALPPAAAYAASPTFTLYDDTAYTSATIGHGAVAASLVPNFACQALFSGGATPTQSQWQSLVQQDNVHPGAPLVLDCENLYLNGSASAAAANLAELQQLQSWARAVAPTQVIGWYGLLGNTSSANYSRYQQLIAQDPNTAFFPSAYTFSTNETTWVTTLTANIAAAANINVAVPVLPYIWPQYHQGSSPSSLSLTFVPGAQWSFELATLHDLGLSGAVAWGGSNSSTCDATCQSTAGSQTWLPATQAFLDWLGTGLPGAADLALNHPATVSSVNVAGREGDKAVDGDPTTRWGSQYADPQWIQLDLGATHQITGVRLVWETAYATAYSIQVSPDGTTWTSIWSTTTGTGGAQVITGLSGSGRCLRIYGTARGTSYGYSLWGLNVYGT